MLKLAPSSERPIVNDPVKAKIIDIFAERIEANRVLRALAERVCDEKPNPKALREEVCRLVQELGCKWLRENGHVDEIVAEFMRIGCEKAAQLPANPHQVAKMLQKPSPRLYDWFNHRYTNAFGWNSFFDLCQVLSLTPSNVLKRAGR